MKKDPKIFLLHVIDSIHEIERNVKGISRAKFLQDVKTQDAVMRRIEIIGEAVRNLSSDFREKHHGIQWKEIAGMRDKLIHEYFGVDLGLIWSTAKKDIPDLKRKILKLLEKL